MSDDLGAAEAPHEPLRGPDGTLLDPVDGWPIFGTFDADGNADPDGEPMSRLRWLAIQQAKDNERIAEVLRRAQEASAPPPSSSPATGRSTWTKDDWASYREAQGHHVDGLTKQQLIDLPDVPATDKENSQ